MEDTPRTQTNPDSGICVVKRYAKRVKRTSQTDAVEERMDLLWNDDWSPLFDRLSPESINDRDRDGRSILSQAICSEAVSTEKIERLLEMGADVNSADGLGYTPLHFAAQQRKVDIVRILLSRSANVNAVDKHGNTPLFRAAFQKNNDEVVRKLVAAGADPMKRNNSEVSPLDLAKKTGDQELIKLLTVDSSS